VSLHDDIYNDLNTVFFNRLELGEVHTFTIVDKTTGLQTSFDAECTFDSDELQRLNETFVTAGFQSVDLLVLIPQCVFPYRPRANQTLIIDNQPYTIRKVDWALGMLSIALAIGVG
jgi:hypothetical protein